MVISEGKSERFITSASGDEHPKLVQNPGTFDMSSYFNWLLWKLADT